MILIFDNGNQLKEIAVADLQDIMTSTEINMGKGKSWNVNKIRNK
jgi:hypothetical protein